MKTYAENRQPAAKTVAPAHKPFAARSFEDNRPEAIAQRKLQQAVNGVSFLVAAPKSRVIQGMFNRAGQTIETLAKLNTELAGYANTSNSRPVAFPFVATAFLRGQTPEEVDLAVATSTAQVYDYMDITEAWDAIDAELISITAPPAEYDRYDDGLFSVYAKSPYQLTVAQQKKLVNAANDQGTKLHRSAKTRNLSMEATAYIHDESANALFSFKIDGMHRGIPKVTVLQQGKVNAGWHEFSR